MYKNANFHLYRLEHIGLWKNASELKIMANDHQLIKFHQASSVIVFVGNGEGVNWYFFQLLYYAS